MITFDDFLSSTAAGASMPTGLTSELQALWLCKRERWEDAHSIAQDIHTPTGGWIHALLHLIEGDLGNAAYWFRKAGKPVRSPSEITSEWEAIAHSLTA